MNKSSRIYRHNRLRKKIFGSENRPRLVVTKSLKHIFAQVIDDNKRHTIISGSTYKIDNGTKQEKAEKLGKVIGENIKNKKITSVVFDRGGSKYHGRIKKFADSVRAEGIKF